MSVWSARSAAPTLPPIPVPALPAVRLQPVANPTPVLVSRWRPDLSLPRLNLSLDRNALFERLAQPTRGAWRAASNLLPQPAMLLRRALARQSQRSLDRDRAEALERMGWRERLATLAMWNEMEAAERWAREQVFQRRYRSELEQGERRTETSSGWRERIADLALWNELEAAERWAREQVMARLRGRGRELTQTSARQLPARLPGRATPGWRARLADLSLWDTLEAVELRLRRRPDAARDPLAPGARRFARLSRTLHGASGLVSRAGGMAGELLRAPMPVRAVGALGMACVVGLWAFQGVSNTETERVAVAEASLEAAYSAVAVPMSWAGIEVPFSAVAVPLSWERDGAPFSALAVPLGTSFAAAETSLGNVAYSAVALPDVAVAARPPVSLDEDRAALRD
jgi:hypothetical protein